MMMQSRVPPGITIACLLAAAACSDDKPGTSTTSSSGAGQGGAGQGGTGPGDGGGGAGVGAIYPLSVGYAWTYDAQPIGAGDGCGSGMKTNTVLSETTVAGKHAFEIDYFCVAGAPIILSPEG